MIPRKILYWAVALLCCLTSHAKSPLRFSNDGSFKILQLTDLHLQLHKPDETARAFARMDSLVMWEKPDFIVVTGDVLYSGNAGVLLQTVVDKLDSFGTPWAIVYGNHDAEHDISRKQMSGIIAGGRHSLNRLGADGELADMEIPVLQRRKPAYYIYLMDSHDYSRDPAIPGYAWLSTEQVGWLKRSVEARTRHGRTPEPSLAFFHIPLCEFAEACKGQEIRGIAAEAVCCPNFNSGMFDAMQQSGSVTGVFVGHDHDNDFIAAHKGIALAYGKYSGTNCEYNNKGKGGRVIVLTAGERGFETWIREDGGSVADRCRFDGNKLDN